MSFKYMSRIFIERHDLFSFYELGHVNSKSALLLKEERLMKMTMSEPRQEKRFDINERLDERAG